MLFRSPLKDLFLNSIDIDQVNDSVPDYFNKFDEHRNEFWRSEERRVGKECRSRRSPYH